MTLSALVLSLSLTAVAPPDVTAAPPSPPPVAEEPDFQEPPGGTDADRALWRALRDETGLATVALARIAQCAFRIRYDRYYESLEALALQDTPERASRARALRARLEADAIAADRAAPKGPKPNIRACRYTLLFLGQAMPEPAGSRLAGKLPGTRDEAVSCLEDMRELHAGAGPRADALEATLHEIDVFLGRAPRADPAQAVRFGEPAVDAR
jgi:hypothetical protein